MTQAELNKKAVKSIFAIDDAKAQLESFGSQLDLGLPPEEDFAPKSFDDLMTVNPSTDPNYGESSEQFGELGDDLQDNQTQKFVIDKFAAIAEKRGGSGITTEDIDDVCAAVQCAQWASGGDLIKGDMPSFINQTIQKARAAQQSQNVSEALPNGTVAEDIEPEAEREAQQAEDQSALDASAPAMEPIEPTVEPTEPSLEPNVDDVAADSLAAGDDLNALDTSIDDAVEDIVPDTVDEPVTAEEDTSLDASKLDGLDDGIDDVDNDLSDLGEPEPAVAEDTEPAAEETAETETETKTESEPASDESTESETTEETTEEKKDVSDDDDEFNFEAVAKKANALVEGSDAEQSAEKEPVVENAEVPVETVAEDTVAPAADAQLPASTEEGEQQVTAEDGENLEECGASAKGETIAECDAGKKAAVQEGADEAEVQAKVESIANEFRVNRMAERVRAQIESYDKKEKQKKAKAQIESIIKDFKAKTETETKSAKVESIISNFAQASKAAHEKAMMEAVAKKESEYKNKLDSILESIQPVKKAPTLSQKLGGILESIQPVEKEAPKAAEVKPALESVASEGDTLQSELDAIVNKLRNA